MIKREADKREIMFILDNLRDEDREELFFHSGADWKSKTLENLDDKETLLLYAQDDKGGQIPVALGGFCETNNPQIACAWLLCSLFINQNKTLFIRELIKQIKTAEKKYKIMYNFIYKSNYKSKKLLKKLGFKFDNPRPEGMKIRKDFEFFYKVTERE